MCIRDSPRGVVGGKQHGRRPGGGSLGGDQGHRGREVPAAGRGQGLGTVAQGTGEGGGGGRKERGGGGA
eukprot:150208-Alexandrium_andersonii.AAC.1